MDNMTEQMVDSLRALINKLERERDEALNRLPEVMKHCTIQFKECELGHGWLTATNWVQHGCPTCAVAAARAQAFTECEAIARAYQTSHEIIRDDWLSQGRRTNADVAQEHVDAAEEIAEDIAKAAGEQK